jgi:hypothetical protein
MHICHHLCVESLCYLFVRSLQAALLPLPLLVASTSPLYTNIKVELREQKSKYKVAALPLHSLLFVSKTLVL